MYIRCIDEGTLPFDRASLRKGGRNPSSLQRVFQRDKGGSDASHCKEADICQSPPEELKNVGNL